MISILNHILAQHTNKLALAKDSRVSCSVQESGDINVEREVIGSLTLNWLGKYYGNLGTRNYYVIDWKRLSIS